MSDLILYLLIGALGGLIVSLFMLRKFRVLLESILSDADVNPRNEIQRSDDVKGDVSNADFKKVYPQALDKLSKCLERLLKDLKSFAEKESQRVLSIDAILKIKNQEPENE